MKNIQNWLNAKEGIKHSRDMMIYGTAIMQVIYRKWWNPLRWILGREKLKCVRPNVVWKS